MEFCKIFTFLTIFKESMTLLPKIWKITTLVAAIYLILLSSSFLIFTCSYQTFIDTAIHAPIFIFPFILFAAEIILLAAYIALAGLSEISTIIVSDMAYTDKRLSPSDLLSRVRQAWKRQGKLSFRFSRKPLYGAVVLGVCVAVVIINDMINLVTITLLGLLILFIYYHLKASVGYILAYVASVVEEISDGMKAAKRGEKLAEGQREKGFMMNLFVNILACVCFLVFWMIVGDKGSLNVTIYGLFFIIFMGLMKIYMSVVVTVFYFQCRKHHGEEIDVDRSIVRNNIHASV